MLAPSRTSHRVRGVTPANDLRHPAKIDTQRRGRIGPCAFPAATIDATDKPRNTNALATPQLGRVLGLTNVGEATEQAFPIDFLPGLLESKWADELAILGAQRGSDERGLARRLFDMSPEEFRQFIGKVIASVAKLSKQFRLATRGVRGSLRAIRSQAMGAVDRYGRQSSQGRSGLGAAVKTEAARVCSEPRLGGVGQSSLRRSRSLLR